MRRKKKQSASLKIRANKATYLIRNVMLYKYCSSNVCPEICFIEFKFNKTLIMLFLVLFLEINNLVININGVYSLSFQP